MIRFRVPLLQALIGLFELPEDDDLPAGEHFIEVDDTGGCSCHFTLFSLIFCAIPVHAESVLFLAIVDKFVCNYLSQ